MQISGLLPLNQKSEKQTYIIIGSCLVVLLYIGLLTSVVVYAVYKYKSADHFRMGIVHFIGYIVNNTYVKAYQTLRTTFT